MLDRYNRKINYLRISVTDRCNLRCTYCMPEDGIAQVKHEDILTFDEITAFIKEAVSLGVNKVRITGGEPLVRKGIVDLVRMIAKISGIDDLSMTTNAVLMSQFAQPLWDAGLRRINVSLDTLDIEKFKLITRGGNINDVFKGLEEAKRVGFNPIKINCVIDKSSNEPDAIAVKEFAISNGFEVRFIPMMNLEQGIFGQVEGGEGGNCSSCNRLRLTANGYIKPCLFSDLGFNIRELGARIAIQTAIGQKPESGSQNLEGEFYNIGG
ncbi:MAG: radical SAM protein [Bacteroidales bacterium]|nr:MAG: radical SAM protein [Bacteroidales bacterium]